VRRLALLIVPLLLVVAVPASAAPAGGCTLKPRKPKVDAQDRFTYKGSFRCLSPVSRRVDMDRRVKLDDGRTITTPMWSWQGTFRAGKGGAVSIGPIGCAAEARRLPGVFKGGKPVSFRIRMTLRSRDGRRLARKTSKARRVGDRCDDIAGGERPPR
jgi:hypothetical protein